MSSDNQLRKNTFTQAYYQLTEGYFGSSEERVLLTM